MSDTFVSCSMWLSGLDVTFEYHHAHDTSISIDIFAVFVGGMTPVRSFIPPKYGIPQTCLKYGSPRTDQVRNQGLGGRWSGCTQDHRLSGLVSCRKFCQRCIGELMTTQTIFSASASNSSTLKPPSPWLNCSSSFFLSTLCSAP